MAKVPPLTLAEVREKLDNKIVEALDFLCDMETWKKDQTRFTHRVSAFLSAADSVIMMIENHAKRYAREHGKEYKFNAWYDAKEGAFRKPIEAHKAKKPNGSDTTWIYLRAARDDTIHIERTELAHLTRVTFKARIHITARLTITMTNHETGAVTVTEPESPPPPESNETKEEKDLWAFKPIRIVYQGKTIADVIDPPTDDVVSVCNRHIDKLIELVEECEQELSAY